MIPTAFCVIFHNVVQNVIQKLYKAPKEGKKGKKLKKGVDKRG